MARQTDELMPATLQLQLGSSHYHCRCPWCCCHVYVGVHELRWREFNRPGHGQEQMDSGPQEQPDLPSPA